MTSANKRQQIIHSLQDKEYRDAYVSEGISVGIATQIRAMQQARGWSQEQLSEHTGIAQETISVLQNPNYGRYTLRTLRRLASAFDVALIVRFVPFSFLADWAAHLSPQDLAVPSFGEDLGILWSLQPEMPGLGEHGFGAVDHMEDLFQENPVTPLTERGDEGFHADSSGPGIRFGGASVYSSIGP